MDKNVKFVIIITLKDTKFQNSKITSIKNIKYKYFSKNKFEKIEYTK